jgi:hypothetical protein
MSCLRLNLENNAADPVAGQGDYGAEDRQRDRCRHLPHARRRRIDRLSRIVQPFGFELPELMGAQRRIDLTD